MNRIDRKFAQLKTAGKTALIPFLTVGDPDLETTADIIMQLEQSGADIVELGVPYSDPLADGPVIQAAAQRALQQNVKLADCIRLARVCRDRGSELAFVLFSYYNPVLQFGLERFFAALQENDISGAIIPDLPFEENGEASALAKRYGIHLIPLVAPTSRERIRRIVADASGFVYLVSSLGVTGERSQFYDGIEAFVDSVRQSTDLPLAIGFGISNREQAARFGKMCDGVIVGSALVRRIEALGPKLTSPAEKAEALAELGKFAASLKDIDG